MAPEVLNSEENEPCYNNLADIWSLGVSIFYLLSLKRPFNKLGDILMNKRSCELK